MQMRRFGFFIILLIISIGLIITLFLASIYWAYPTNSQQPSWMNDMWCMGGTSSSGTVSQPYLWLIPVGLAGIAILGVVGAVYFFVYPEIRTIAPVDKNANVPKPSPNVANNPYSAVYKTLKPDEKKVLEVLTAHDGKYLQKYIRKEAKLSRLRVHRILARLAERGVVSLKKSGNTNEVILTDWLKPE